MPTPPGSRRTIHKSSEFTPETSPTSRKAPRCSVCKLLRKGHPRNRCPYAEEVNQGKTEPESPTRNVADALRLTLAADTGDERDGVAAAGDEVSAGTKKNRRITLIPGTLLTSTTSLLHSQFSNPSRKEESPPALGSQFISSYISEPYPNPTQLFDTGLTAGDSTPRTPRAESPMDATTRFLTRTLPYDESTQFAASLARLTKASVYVLPAADISAICATAAACGLSTRTLPFNHTDGLVIVGQTTAAVEVLFYQVEAGMHALVPPLPASSSALKMAAQTLFVTAAGAAAAWVLLAFC
ncbi:hypothetical protein C8R43DRAFT_1123015 [Mycena crocata]|nr:hypothetical protein C8R43DRAFT_1123015 [Mycena crocata]